MADDDAQNLREEVIDMEKDSLRKPQGIDTDMDGVDKVAAKEGHELWLTPIRTGVYISDDGDRQEFAWLQTPYEPCEVLDLGGCTVKVNHNVEEPEFGQKVKRILDGFMTEFDEVMR